MNFLVIVIIYLFDFEFFNLHRTFALSMLFEVLVVAASPLSGIFLSKLLHLFPLSTAKFVLLNFDLLLLCFLVGVAVSLQLNFILAELNHLKLLSFAELIELDIFGWV